MSDGRPRPSAEEAAAARRRRILGWLAPLGSLAFFGALLGVGWMTSQDAVATAEVGECVQVDESNAENPYSTGDCADPATTLTVVARVVDGGDCRAVPGAVRSFTHFDEDATVEVCLGEKGVDPASTVNVAQAGDCLSGTGDERRRVPCTDPAATHTIVERIDGVSRIELPTACDDAPGATEIYSWTWESDGGLNISGLGVDAAFCLAPVRG